MRKPMRKPRVDKAYKPSPLFLKEINNLDHQKTNRHQPSPIPSPLFSKEINNLD